MLIIDVHAEILAQFPGKGLPVDRLQEADPG